MLIGQDGISVVIDAQTAAWLERYAGLSQLRVRVRGTNPKVSKALEEIRTAAMTWSGSAVGTTGDNTPEPAAESRCQVMTTGQAAELAGVTSRAIRKAVAEGRLPASSAGGQWQFDRHDVEHYKAARAA